MHLAVSGLRLRGRPDPNRRRQIRAGYVDDSRYLRQRRLQHIRALAAPPKIKSPPQICRNLFLHEIRRAPPLGARFHFAVFAVSRRKINRIATSQLAMKNHVFRFAPLFVLALSGLGLAACGKDFSGTYKGEATETGTLKVAHIQAPAVATNEAPPRKVPDQSVTVSKSGDEYVVKFNACEMKGKSSGTSSILVSSPCDVKITSWEGKMNLSATLNFDEQGGLNMSVTGTEKKNNETVASYDYIFKGKK